MTKIIMETDCGNSPKREFLKELNVAFAERNLDFIGENVTDDITWNQVGNQQITGKADFVQALEELRTTATVEIAIQRVITHGKEGAVSGEFLLDNGAKYAYCDTYEFRSTASSTIKTITSYMIKIS